MAANKFIKLSLSLISIGIVLGCVSGNHVAGPVGLGRPISENQIRAWDIDIDPSGSGLPPGSGTAIIGEKLYQQQCASCHGDQGQGGPANRLVGGGALNTDKPVKTVGSFWPYSTTIFDYVKRAMPHQSPQSLTDDQVYAATAYILYLNKIIAKDAVMDAKTLPLVKMPNKDGFIPVER
ncbi:cytochrome c [Polynucleobacter sp. MG-28-Ekke-A2]|uniref:c-type cytochrome n=1 Tax=Polynucleobacter sp. MG-28-Ekke-A2 TaxID=3108276 RepID=UPI002B23A3F8|nr:cytochrome c [Polynucleobacter sp. MG-28-Ekke-A2]MEA9601390.1 cytochrome c [Polynucleobacter sp. MG-28-Ekke-A2]